MIVSLTTEVQLMAIHVTVFRNMQGKLKYTDELVTKQIKYNTVYSITLHFVRHLTLFNDHPWSPSSLSQSYAERANDEETTH